MTMWLDRTASYSAAVNHCESEFLLLTAAPLLVSEQKFAMAVSSDHACTLGQNTSGIATLIRTEPFSVGTMDSRAEGVLIKKDTAQAMIPQQVRLCASDA